MSGFGAWLLWLLVHVDGLTGFKNRVSPVLSWSFAFLGRGRPQRVITAQQIFARGALAAPTTRQRGSPPRDSRTANDMS